MKTLLLTALLLLFVSLASLEAVMSSLPDEPIIPADLQESAATTGGARPLLCDTRGLLGPVPCETAPGS